jgi:hypothetical protein
MLLIVTGIVLVGLAAGFAFATFQTRRFGRSMVEAGYLREEAESPVVGRRLALCTAVALVGIVLIVVGALT